MLGDTQCDKLTRLQILFNDFTKIDGYPTHHRGLLQDLIKNIHNTPSLEYITFKETAVRLIDMENLHTNLSRLKSVVLDKVSKYHNDNISDVIPISPKNALQSFSLNFELAEPHEEDLIIAASNWISYIGADYMNLQKLNLEGGQNATAFSVEKGTVLESLKDAMTNMTQINSHSINFLPLSNSIVKVMYTNNIQLESLKLMVEESEEFQCLESAKSAHTLKSLEIISHNFADNLVAYQGLFHLLNNLKYLTHLTIRGYRTGQLGFIFYDILQHLVALENSAFEGLYKHDQDNKEEDCMTISNKLDVVKSGQLKSLCLNVYASGKEATMKKFSLLVQFILKSSPLLEMLQLYGFIRAYGVLNLNFRKHAKLKRVVIGLEGCKCYNFHPPVLWQSMEKP